MKLGVLDIGSDKICCLIAVIEKDNQPKIEGIGYRDSRGIKSGIITDMELAQTSITSAIQAAEKMSGVTLDEFIVNFSSNTIQSDLVNLTVSLDGNEISSQDLKNADKKAGEIISAITFDIPDRNTEFNFEKVSKRITLDIASVNTAVQISVSDNKITQIHLSAGGVAPIPLYMGKTCTYLRGKELSPRHIKSANEVLQSEINPISDVRGSAEYKRILLRQLYYAHFIKLFPNQFALEQLI